MVDPVILAFIISPYLFQQHRQSSGNVSDRHENLRITHQESGGSGNMEAKTLDMAITSRTLEGGRDHTTCRFGKRLWNCVTENSEMKGILAAIVAGNP